MQALITERAVAQKKAVIPVHRWPVKHRKSRTWRASKYMATSKGKWVRERKTEHNRRRSPRIFRVWKSKRETSQYQDWVCPHLPSPRTLQTVKVSLFKLISMNLPKLIPLSDLTSRANPQWNIPLPPLSAGFSWTNSAWERATECRTSLPNIWSLRISSLPKWNINKWINGTFLLEPRATRNPDSLSGLEEENSCLFVAFFHPCSWTICGFWNRKQSKTRAETYTKPNRFICAYKSILAAIGSQFSVHIFLHQPGLTSLTAMNVNSYFDEIIIHGVNQRGMLMTCSHINAST